MTIHRPHIDQPHEDLMKIAEIFSKTIKKTFPKSKGNLIMFGFVGDDDLVHNFTWNNGVEWEEATRIAMGCNGMIYNKFTR